MMTLPIRSAQAHLDYHGCWPHWACIFVRQCCHHCKSPVGFHCRSIRFEMLHIAIRGAWPSRMDNWKRILCPQRHGRFQSYHTAHALCLIKLQNREQLQRANITTSVQMMLVRTSVQSGNISRPKSHQTILYIYNHKEPGKPKWQAVSCLSLFSFMSAMHLP